MISRNYRKGMQFTDTVAHLYPELTDRAKDAGYERPLTQTMTFQVTDDCNLACFIAGTKILMDDFSYKNIEDVKIGDKVLAFNEKTPPKKQIKLVPTTVTHTFVRHDYVRKIQTKDGKEIICTNEHPFLDGRRQWVRAEDINTSKKLMKFLGLKPYEKADINSLDYIKGYTISAFLGDGHMFFYKHCNPVSNPTGSQSRLAVKDTEILERIKTYLPILDIEFTTHPFKISTIDNMYIDAIYLNKVNSLKLKELIETNWNINDTYNYYCGFLAGIIDTEGHVERKCDYIRIFNSHDGVIKQCQTALEALGFAYTMEKEREGTNLTLKVLRLLNPRNTTEVLRFQLIIQCAVTRKGYQTYYGSAAFKREDVVENTKTYAYETVYNLETETHTYIANDFAVHNCNYCYQTCKGKRRMSFETAKKAIDMLLTGEKGMSEYINPIASPGLILEFIGGEPFLEIELIQQIYEYFLDRAIELDHPWATLHRISICSNGVLYFDPKVQEFLNKYKYNLSFSVTVDGNKELHDSCRVFPDGSPSYDLAVAAAKDWMDKSRIMGSKITIAPGNVMHLYEALVHMVELGYDDINANCVYEKGWTTTHAVVLYAEMKRVADYFLNSDIDFLDGSFRCSLYENRFFKPKDPNDLGTWCGGGGFMLSVDPDGVFYPCIRYMESSLNGEQEPYSIGNVDDGLCAHECEKCRVAALKKVNRRTENTDECFYCPIAEGCSNCLAYDYQVNGTPDKRATYICIMHKARALGNIYFWNKYYRKHNMSDRMKMYIPDKWALEIITQTELDMLKELSKEDS